MDYYIIRRGKYIFSGNSKGKILIVDANTLAQKSCFRVTQTAAVNNAVKVFKVLFIRLTNLHLKEIIVCNLDSCNM